MIQKTPAEKQALKEAKLAHRAGVREYQAQRGHVKKERETKALTYNNKGVLPSEKLLDNDYPVYWDYLYVIDDNGGKVIRSDIKGTVRHLKADLQKQGMKAENVYTCDIAQRKIIFQ